MRAFIDRVAQAVRAPLGRWLGSRAHDWRDVRSFIPFEETVSRARAAGLSVGDYIDAVMNRAPGMTQEAVDRLTAMGIFSPSIGTALEIGPGSGRYLEKVLKACAPRRYEVYETAPDWADYLGRHYPVIVQPTDGRSLAATATGSVDLAQAYKVFSTIPFVATCRYWAEMVRVVGPRGTCVFDVMTENCLSPATVDTWAASGIENGSFPASLPRAVVTGFFETNGFELIGSFLGPMPPGQTETMVFRRTGGA
jgi:hypothetical protein